MNADIKNQNITTIPLMISQIAYALKQLSPDQVELLEAELDQDFADEILTRGQTAWQEYEQGNTLTLDQLRKELNLQ